LNQKVKVIPEQWYCGCLTWTHGKIFYIKPCKDINCKIKQEILKQSLDRGNKIVEY